MSIQTEIDRIKGNIASAYSSAGAKGATLPAVQNSANLAGCIDTITGGGGEPATKFGASVETWIGDVNENGVLGKPTIQTELNFAGVKSVGYRCLYYVFYELAGITSVDFSSLQSIGDYGLCYAFYGCTGITSINLSSLQSIGRYAMNYTFYECTGITSVDLSSLQTIGELGASNAFYGCTGITSVDLSSLQTIDGGGARSMFYGCNKLTTVSFPSLTSVQSSSFGTSTSNGTFRNCTGLTEIHFRADMQATIEAMSQYANKWGATSSTIYFDL